MNKLHIHLFIWVSQLEERMNNWIGRKASTRELRGRDPQDSGLSYVPWPKTTHPQRGWMTGHGSHNKSRLAPRSVLFSRNTRGVRQSDNMCIYRGATKRCAQIRWGTSQDGSLTLALLLAVSFSLYLTFAHIDDLTVFWLFFFKFKHCVNVSVIPVSYTKWKSLKKVPWSKLYWSKYMHITNTYCQLSTNKNGYINLHSREYKFIEMFPHIDQHRILSFLAFPHLIGDQ